MAIPVIQVTQQNLVVSQDSVNANISVIDDVVQVTVALAPPSTIQVTPEVVNLSVNNITGPASVMDQNDVVKQALIDIENESILVFNSNIQRFETETFLSVLDRLKGELEVQYARIIDGEGSFTYVGEAIPGTATGSVTWRIKRIEEVNADDLNVFWADGTADFDKSWDLRATYTY